MGKRAKLVNIPLSLALLADSISVMTVQAIYENGVFRPTEPVDLPERARVEFEPKVIPPIRTDEPVRTELTPKQAEAMRRLYETMSKRFRSGRHDIAERHNEHQP